LRGHVALLTPEFLHQLGLSALVKVLDADSMLRS
jgi:hypothetical protein